MSDSFYSSAFVEQVKPFIGRWADFFWQQHSDPIAFLRQVEQGDGWRSVFLARLLFGAGVVLVLIFIAFLNQEVWRFVIGYGAIAFFLLPMSIGVPIMMSHHHQFWFAYWLSPPLLLIALLCGWIAFTSLGWIGWLMLLYAIGTIVGVTGAVWVHKCLRTEERTQARRRAGGASAELPHLRLWKRVRWLRLGVGVITLLGALLLLFLEPPEVLGMLIALIFAAGSVHLDAMLLSFKGPLPLVRYDTSQQRWRTTYSGRFALFVPRHNIYQLLTTLSARGRRGEGAKGRVGEGAKGRRGEGARGRKSEGAKGRRGERAKGRRGEGAKERGGEGAKERGGLVTLGRRGETATANGETANGETANGETANDETANGETANGETANGRCRCRFAKGYTEPTRTRGLGDSWAKGRSEGGLPPQSWGGLRGGGRDGAEIVLALLREGTLGPSIRRACALLSPTEAHRLLLHLSLQAGGAAAIRYLEPALSPELRPMAFQYAALASEAAKPSDLQRFLNALPSQFQPELPPLETEPQNPVLSPRRIRHEVSIQRLLAQVREVLLSYEFSPQLEQPYQELQQFVKTVESSRPQDDSPIASWPVALLQHLEAHRQRLKNA